jgi:hypothetical protein
MLGDTYTGQLDAINQLLSQAASQASATTEAQVAAYAQATNTLLKAAKQGQSLAPTIPGVSGASIAIVTADAGVINVLSQDIAIRAVTDPSTSMSLAIAKSDYTAASSLAEKLYVTLQQEVARYEATLTPQPTPAPSPVVPPTPPPAASASSSGGLATFVAIAAVAAVAIGVGLTLRRRSR